MISWWQVHHWGYFSNGTEPTTSAISCNLTFLGCKLLFIFFSRLWQFRSASLHSQLQPQPWHFVRQVLLILQLSSDELVENKRKDFRSFLGQIYSFLVFLLENAKKFIKWLKFIYLPTLTTSAIARIILRDWLHPYTRTQCRILFRLGKTNDGRSREASKSSLAMVAHDLALLFSAIFLRGGNSRASGKSQGFRN